VGERKPPLFISPSREGGGESPFLNFPSRSRRDIKYGD